MEDNDISTQHYTIVENDPAACVYHKKSEAEQYLQL